MTMACRGSDFGFLDPWKWE